MTKKKEIALEEALHQMESIVEKLENGDVPLEEAMKLFQEGMVLSQLCHTKLENIQQEIVTLTEKNGELVEKKIEIKEE